MFAKGCTFTGIGTALELDPSQKLTMLFPYKAKYVFTEYTLGGGAQTVNNLAGRGSVLAHQVPARLQEQSPSNRYMQEIPTLPNGNFSNRAVQHGAVQHGAVQHAAVQHGAVQHGAVQHGERAE